MKPLKLILLAIPFLFAASFLQANTLKDSTNTNIGINGNNDSFGSAGGRILVSDLGKVYSGAETVFFGKAPGAISYRVVWPILQRRYTGTGWQSLGNISSGTLNVKDYYGNGHSYGLYPSGLLVEVFSGGGMMSGATKTGFGTARWVK